MIAKKIVLTFAILSAAMNAEAQTAIDLGTLQLKPGTQTLITTDDTFSMNGQSFTTNLPQCQIGQSWHIYDPTQPQFPALYVITGTTPAGSRFNFRDPVNGNYVANDVTSLLCQ